MLSSKVWQIASWPDGYCNLTWQTNLIFVKWSKKFGKEVTISSGWTHVRIYFIGFYFSLSYRNI